MGYFADKGNYDSCNLNLNFPFHCKLAQVSNKQASYVIIVNFQISSISQDTLYRIFRQQNCVIVKKKIQLVPKWKKPKIYIY